jgi:hypothetical protein
MRSEPRRPSTISERHGRSRNVSKLGNGMCRKKPMAASGTCSRIMAGSSMRW